MEKQTSAHQEKKQRMNSHVRLRYERAETSGVEANRIRNGNPRMIATVQKRTVKSTSPIT